MSRSIIIAHSSFKVLRKIFTSVLILQTQTLTTIKRELFGNNKLCHYRLLSSLFKNSEHMFQNLRSFLSVGHVRHRHTSGTNIQRQLEILYEKECNKVISLTEAFSYNFMVGFLCVSTLVVK